MTERSCVERQIPLYPDFKLAAKHWPNPKGIPTLALHGWLDNANSFALIAPHLPELDLVALDFPGHGLSSHKPESCFFHILDLVVETFKVIQALGWESCVLLGHSLGAAVASLMAGTLPNQVRKLILIDGLGGLSTPADHAPKQLQKFVESSLSERSSKLPVYKTLDAAVMARQQASDISEAGVKALVDRGTKAVPGGFTWRTDPRLLKSSAIYLTEEQNLSFLNRIEAHTLVIRPEPGYPFTASTMSKRLGAIKYLKLEKLKGQHHIHLDQPDSVAKLVQSFTSS